MTHTDTMPTKRLKVAAHNPAGRVEAKRLRPLLQSIKTIGLIYPIVVDPSGTVIDGHRRLAAVKKLGWKDVPVRVVTGDNDAVYAAVNATACKMSGNDALVVWLKNPAAVTARTDKINATVESVIGRALLQKVATAGLSVRVYRTAVHIAKYCDDTTPANVRRIVEWLMAFDQIGQVMKALEMGQPARVIAQAVKKHKPIKFNIGVAA